MGWRKGPPCIAVGPFVFAAVAAVDRQTAGGWRLSLQNGAGQLGIVSVNLLEKFILTYIIPPRRKPNAGPFSTCSWDKSNFIKEQLKQKRTSITTATRANHWASHVLWGSHRPTSCRLQLGIENQWNNYWKLANITTSSGLQKNIPTLIASAAYQMNSDELNWFTQVHTWRIAAFGFLLDSTETLWLYTRFEFVISSFFTVTLTRVC